MVGRNEVVKKTVEIDRLNCRSNRSRAPSCKKRSCYAIFNSSRPRIATNYCKELVDFWAKELSRPGGIKFDEQTLREALIRKMKLTPPPLQATPEPR